MNAYCTNSIVFPKNFIYGLIDPRNNEIRYIGKTCHGLKRIISHQTPANLKKRTHKVNWINELKKLNLKFKYVIIHIVDDSNKLSELEKYYISMYNILGCNLTNSTEGGEGSPGRVVTDETRKKISKGRLGQKVKLEIKEKISQTLLKKRKNPYKLHIIELPYKRKARYDRCKPFICLETGRIYNSQTEFARELNCRTSGICEVLQKKSGRRTIRGFHLEYL